jgi:hypothetical protein
MSTDNTITHEAPMDLENFLFGGEDVYTLDGMPKPSQVKLVSPFPFPSPHPTPNHMPRSSASRGGPPACRERSENQGRARMLDARRCAASSHGVELATAPAVLPPELPNANTHCDTAMQKLRIVTLGFREMSSRGRFATPADFPPRDCSPYSHVHVRRERLGFVHRSRTILCRPVPNPNDSHFFASLYVTGWARARAAGSKLLRQRRRQRKQPVQR